MTDDLIAALRPLLARLDAALADRPALRRDLAAAARAFADALAPPAEAGAGRGFEQAAEPQVVLPVPPPAALPPAPRPAAILPRPVSPPLPVAGFDEERRLVDPQQPGVIAARCRVKADAARLVADRLGEGVGAGALLAADLTARAAELPDCSLWMLYPGNYSESRAAWHDLSESYKAAAAAADLLRTWFDLPPEEADRYAGDVLPLSAEAQSTLYAAAIDIGRRGHDQDQLELFATVKEEAKEREVFIRRFLKKEDRADPATAPEVARRVADLTTTLRDRTARAGARRKMIDNLKYKVKRLKADPDTHADQWPRVVELLDKLVADGLPPSNVEIRDLLLPVLDRFPPGLELPRNVGFVFRSIGDYLDGRPDADSDDAEDDGYSPEVAEVARLIGGRELVLIGGQARPAHRAALIRAFKLADLDWIVTPEHESYHVFEPAVRRSETAAVVLAIRWSSHSYSEVQRYCDEYDKPLVRLPGGYNANQLAHQILSQVGEKLRAATN